jgi:hypothetical protein
VFSGIQAYETEFYSVMVRLNLTWRDRRLNYMNLKHDFYQNLVNLEEKQKIWLPTVGKIIEMINIHELHKFSEGKNN